MGTARSRTLAVMTVVAVVVLLLMTGCIRIVTGSETVTGTPDMETREFDFADFTRVDVGYAFEVDVTRADTHSVSITMNDNLFDYLDVTLSGTTLRIRMLSNHNYVRATRRASVTLPVLRSLELSGASRGEVSGFSGGDDVDFEVSGASSLTLVGIRVDGASFDVSGASRATGDITMADGDFSVSGASTVELEGRADDIRLEVSGASTARLADFPMKSADVRVSGASNATVDVSDRLDIDISGASRLVYDGDAELGSVQVSGGSTLSRR